jgi:tRNA threonylcarbamoyladenosine biosynthesis protein TsaB
MANCIAIDTSSEACSVSLVVGGELSDTSISVPKSHAKSLLPFIHELLLSRQARLDDLDFIACSDGPGSFTGLRIGLGVAQGLAFGAGKPMVGVSSLAAQARAAHGRNPSADLVVSLLDARMGEIYWSATEFSLSSASVAVGPRLDSIADVNIQLAELISGNPGKNVLLAGAAVVLLDDSLLHKPKIIVDADVAPNAIQVAEIALELWRDGISCSPQDFQLNYLRNSVSWNKRQRIRQ